MRILIQRVSQASVTINSIIKSNISHGLLILLGIEPTDTQEDADWLCKKIAALRIFDDEAGVMNKSIVDVDGEALVVSQFTLMASTKKGNRPSYIHAAGEAVAVPLYESFKAKLSVAIGGPIPCGRFGADMKVTPGIL